MVFELVIFDGNLSGKQNLKRDRYTTYLRLFGCSIMIENNTNLQTIIKMHNFDGNVCIIYFQHFTTIL